MDRASRLPAIASSCWSVSLTHSLFALALSRSQSPSMQSHSIPLLGGVGGAGTLGRITDGERWDDRARGGMPGIQFARGLPGKRAARQGLADPEGLAALALEQQDPVAEA